MTKRILAAALTLLLCFALYACSGAPSPAQTGENDAPGPVQTEGNDARTPGPAAEIRSMVLSREIIPQDYFCCLDESLVQQIKQYNSLTAQLHLYYTGHAAGIAKALFYEHGGDPGDYQHSEMYFEWIGRIARYALYENAAELCCNDPYLAYPLAKEAGGSFGMWAQQLHENAPEDIKLQLQEYFTLIRTLLTQTNDKD